MIRTGVYLIVNPISGNFYIGSSRRSFAERCSKHLSLLRKNIHKNRYLQNSFNSTGELLFCILERIEGEELILDREQYYITTLNPKYNIAKNVRQPSLGIPMPEEHKERLRQMNLGRVPWNKGIPFNEDVKKLMSINGKGKNKFRVYEKNLSTNSVIRSDGVHYKNVNFAAKDLNVKTNTIVKSIRDTSQYRTVKGFRFQYEKDIEKGFGSPDEIDPRANIQINGDRFVVRYTDVNNIKVYKGRFKTLEEAISIRNKAYEDNPPKLLSNRKIRGKK